MTAALSLLLASCYSEQPTETVLRDDVHGVELIAEHLEGPALSQPEDKLLLVDDDDRKLIFEGYGGSSLSLLSAQRGTLIVSYCGGSIRKTESFLVDDEESGGVLAVKVQPVVAGGLQLNGEVICGDELPTVGP